LCLWKKNFEPRQEWYQKEEANAENQQDVKEEQIYAPMITMWIDKKEAYRVYDRFCESDIEILEDGNFMVRVAYPLDEWVYGLVLSFGASAKVLEPLEIREEIKKRIADMQKNYT